MCSPLGPRLKLVFLKKNLVFVRCLTSSCICMHAGLVLPCRPVPAPCCLLYTYSSFVFTWIIYTTSRTSNNIVYASITLWSTTCLRVVGWNYFCSLLIETIQIQINAAVHRSYSITSICFSVCWNRYSLIVVRSPWWDIPSRLASKQAR